MQMEMNAATQNVERVFQSLEESQRNIADQWSQVMRNAALPRQADATEAILQSQNELLRSSMRVFDPSSFIGALSGSWLTLPRGLATTTLELQRRMLEAWSGNEELRPEAIAQRWTGPWLETVRAMQDAGSRMIEMQSTWIRSLASDTQQQRSRGASSGSRSRSSSGQQAQQRRRRSSNGRRSASQRAH